MVLVEFLKQIQANPSCEGASVIALESESYPSSLLSSLFASLKSRTHCASLDTKQYKFADIKAQLETSFLGMRLIYWVKNVHELDAATKKQWQVYVKAYQGPHCIIYWDEQGKTRSARKKRSQSRR